MTAIQLDRFVRNHELEYHWHKDDVLLFVPTWDVQEFNKLFDASKFDDGGIECHMLDGYFAFAMSDICDYYGIEMVEIFDKETEY